MKARGHVFQAFLLSLSICALRNMSVAQESPLLFVANAGNNTIYQYTSNGVGTLFANTNLSNPQALVFDAAGNLYVANNGNNTIVKFDSHGVGSVFASNGLSGPVGLAFDTTGNLYAANQNDGTIEKFTPAGVGTQFVSGLVGPGGLAFDNLGNLFAVADSSVYKITPAGVRTTFATGFSSPTFVAFDGAGNLYVGEYGNADIKRFTPAGVGSVFASSGVNYPYQMAFDRNSNLYVINHYGNNVESFSPAGAGTVFASSGINGPNGIAIAPSQALHHPLAVNISASTQQNKSMILSVEKVVASAINPDGISISLSTVSANSTNGGTVGIFTNSVVYTPVSNYTGSDQFSYTITDGNGGSSSANVFVQVQPGTAPSNNMLPLTPVSGGYIVSFAGIPGRTYTVQRAPTVNGPWISLATVTVGLSGIASFTDTNAPPEGAFYRVSYQ